jgi:RNA polymerase sigma-70 factor (ECF subfamily)
MRREGKDIVLEGEPLESLTDEQLVTLSRDGNADAFNWLVRRWEGSLFRFARRTLGNSDDARDVCQEALVKAYQNIPRLREGAKFKSWIHHITLNLCRDRFRAAKVRGESLSVEDVAEGVLAGAMAPGQAESAERAAASGSVRGVLGELLAGLPHEQRTCLLLREFQGFTSEEISEITGVPSATVRTRIYYGLKAIRRMMETRGLSEADFR